MNFDHYFKLFLTTLLAVIGFFLMQTFATIKSLEKDIITIREKLSALEATRLTRRDIAEMISEYHDHHPCVRYALDIDQPKKKKEKKDEED